MTATQVRTVNHGNGITSNIFTGRCPGCSQPRRHTSDGLRQCGGCKLVYELVVVSVIGAEAA